MSPAPRRTIAARIAGTLAALLATPAFAERATEDADWPGPKSTRHRLLVDAYTVNGGQPLNYAHTFLATNPPGAASVVLVLRYTALPLALSSAVWSKYRIGEGLKIADPATKSPAQQNPYLSRPGGKPDEATVDRLLAAGVVIGACGVALKGQSRMLAANAGLTPEQAEAEWAANLLPGITLMPSGVWGVGLAQEAGCAYCAGGG